MSLHIPVSLRRRVRERAANRCEYCRLGQEFQEATFHIDHVQPRADDGPTVLDNLALACVSCSLFKGARLSAVDPGTGREESLFNPRHQAWGEHFELDEAMSLRGLTPNGRATVEALRMNRPLAVAIRREENERGRYP